MSTGARLEGHSNNFDALRLYAAMVVIYGHGFNMAGLTGPGLFGVPFARVGLDIFFSISGFLVTTSWEHTPRLIPFALKRGLRIWPGLIACSVLTAYLLGPVVTTVPLASYLASPYPFRYLLNIAFDIRLYLPGVFLHAHYPGVVNGSLWSLFPEVLCYCTVPIFALLPRRLRLVLLPATGVVLGAIGLWMFEGPDPSTTHVYGAELRYLLVTVPFFFVAAAYGLASQRGADFFRGDIAILLLLANIGFSAWFDWWNVPLEWLTLPYVVIFFGRSSMPVLRHAARLGDLSYGAYLWAFPIQVLLLEAMPHDANSILICMALSLLAGFVSWHLFERPAIVLGRRLPFVARRLRPPASPLTPAEALRAWWRDVLIRLQRRACETPPHLLALAPPAALAACALLAYAGQLHLGRWQSDEYLLFTAQHRWGWHALLPRLSYSPRPVSELLLFLYGRAVFLLHRPLIGSFLALLWAAILLGPALGLRGSLPPGRLRGAVALALPAAILVFVLNTAELSEAFFWPMAAAAYLPTVAAMTALMFLLGAPADRVPRRLACATCLLVAAGSSEMGAAASLAFAAGMAVLWLVETPRGPIARQAWWCVPGLAALIVFAVLLQIREPLAELRFAPRAATGHLGASLGDAFAAALSEVARFDTGGVLGDPGVALPLRLALGLGIALLAVPAGLALTGRRQVVLAASLLFAILFSLSAARFHYGSICCERQDTTRSWMFDLLAILLAAALAKRTGPRLRKLASGLNQVWIASVLLVLALLPVLLRLPAFEADAAVEHLAHDARKRSWLSGLAPGPTMKFFLPPDGSGLLVRGTAEPIGTFAVGPHTAETTDAVGRFFGKSTVIVCQPWQDEKSYLLDGRFIPACPPHAGPPDVVYNSPRA